MMKREPQKQSASSSDDGGTSTGKAARAHLAATFEPPIAFGLRRPVLSTVPLLPVASRGSGTGRKL